MKMKAFMNWSGGKDSALALYKAKQQGIPVEALLTSISSSTVWVSLHGVRRELLEQRASSIGLPLHTIELPEMLAASKAWSGCPVSCKTKLVISTMLLIGLSPIDFNLFCNHSGDGATVILLIETPV